MFTVDADGQHELAVFEELQRIAIEQSLDALLVRRDLSTYPRYKQVGNALMSWWATRWAGGVRLHDVESGYRVFRLGALAHALDFYRGWRYSETVEVAVVLCRLGYDGPQRRRGTGAAVPLADADEGRRDRPGRHPVGGRPGGVAPARAVGRTPPDRGRRETSRAQHDVL